MKNKKAFSMFFVLIMIAFILSLGVIVLNKQTFFEKSYQFSLGEQNMFKKVLFQAESSMNQLIDLNKNGGIYKPFLSCPKDVIYFSGGVNTLVEKFDFLNNACVGYVKGNPLFIYFSQDYENFSSGVYLGNTFSLTGSFFMTGIISPQQRVMFEKTSFFDTKFVTPRIESQGIITGAQEWENIFWNNNQLSDFIQSNTNNTGSMFINVGDVGSGAIKLDVTESCTGKIIEFDKNIFQSQRKLVPINQTTFSISGSGAIGYIQNNGTLNNSLVSAKIFDFKNKQYALFLSYNGSSGKTLRYRMSIDSLDGKKVYFVPIKDDTNKLEFRAGNIILFDGLFVNKIYKFNVYK